MGRMNLSLTAETGPTATLAVWCAETPQAWSPVALERAGRAVLDTVAVMLAGQGETCVRNTRTAVQSWGTGPCYAVGGSPLAAPWAALVNGTAAHALDYDDVLEPAMSHPSAALVPALLALAESEVASGADVLDAFLVGFEVMARLGEAMNQIHYSRGWHTTLSIGAVGVAAACARLLGMNASRMAMAISLATSMAGGSKRQFGSMAKPLHAGLAAKNGLVAAQLAASGVDGIEEPLDGRWGYLDLMAGETAPGLDVALIGLGGRSAIEQYGVWAKYYPCCASTHRPIDALRSMELRSDQVGSITAWVSEIAFANLRYHVPQSPDEARFSMPYCLAAALVDGTISIRSFTAEAIARPALLPIMAMVELAVDPSQAADRPIADVVERGTVEAILVSGERRRVEVSIPRGHPDSPFTEEELERKFRNCAVGVLTPSHIGDVYAQLHGFAELPNLVGLTRLLRA